jgi:hypothetical protein
VTALTDHSTPSRVLCALTRIFPVLALSAGLLISIAPDCGVATTIAFPALWATQLRLQQLRAGSPR